MHSAWSDGACSLEELVEACRRRGYRYMAITDHSQFLKVANGLTPDRLRRQREEIERLNARYSDFTILAGIEMDILPDGTLDYDDDVLKELDFVIAAIHSAFKQPREAIMKRLEAAFRNPYVDVIAHPTGRLIGQRGGYDVDLDRLMKLAAETNTVLELNANPSRLDLSAAYVKKPRKRGRILPLTRTPTIWTCLMIWLLAWRRQGKAGSRTKRSSTHGRLTSCGSFCATNERNE